MHNVIKMRFQKHLTVNRHPIIIWKKRHSNSIIQKGPPMEAMNYVNPKLIVVAFVLYFFGGALRQAQTVKNKYT